MVRKDCPHVTLIFNAMTACIYEDIKPGCTIMKHYIFENFCFFHDLSERLIKEPEVPSWRCEWVLVIDLRYVLKESFDSFIILLHGHKVSQVASFSCVTSNAQDEGHMLSKMRPIGELSFFHFIYNPVR